MPLPPQIPVLKNPVAKPVQIQRSANEVPERFQKGMALLQQGRLAEAKSMFESLLQLNPGHFDALHLLGLIEGQSGNAKAAADLIAKAITINPNVAAFYFSHANALEELGRPEDAVANYDKAISLDPEFADAYYNRGLALKQLNRLDAAIASYDKAISINPDEADAHSNRGLALAGLKQFVDAVASYDKAISINPRIAESHYNRGNALQELGQPDAAVASYDRAVSVNPAYVQAWSNRGLALQALKEPDAAVASYDKAISIRPDFAEAWSNRGLALEELAQLEDALASFDKAIGIYPEYAEACSNRGLALIKLKRLDEAVASFDKAISINPESAQAYWNRGLALKELGQLDKAVSSYDKAINIRPDYAEAWSSRGLALAELGRHDDAVASHDEAIRVRPDYAEAWSNRGLALNELRQPDIALASCDKAISIKPDLAEAHSNRGNALQELRQMEAAIASYDRAIRIKPDYVHAWSNRGLALQKLGRLDDAVASHDNAIRINPVYAEAHSNRAIALEDLGKLDEALASYDRAISINPAIAYLLGHRANAARSMCEWNLDHAHMETIETRIANGEKVAEPFAALAFTASPELQRKAAELWAGDQHPADKSQPAPAGHPRHEKIRIAYVSSDFREHPASYNMAGVFENLDKERFEISAISLGEKSTGDMRRRLEQSFHHFIDVDNKTDSQIAALMREMEIDIAVDIMGATRNQRTGIFAMRAAPIQVNHYAFTCGAPHMDYIIADPTSIPEGHEIHFSEAPAFLRHTLFATDNTRSISGKLPSRADAGLPQDGFVFCCFNNSYKITPGVFDIWMRLLAKVDGSVLWLKATNPEMTRNLRREAQRRGVDANRLVFAGNVDKMEDHLARHRMADLFLDTLAFNAQTTACDALWSGLPLVTCPGRSMVSRVAAGLLNAIVLPELIAKSTEEYEGLAFALATDPGKLLKIKKTLDANRLTTPLFNTQRYVRDLENVFREMYERHRSGLAPARIEAQA